MTSSPLKNLYLYTITFIISLQATANGFACEFKNLQFSIFDYVDTYTCSIRTFDSSDVIGIHEEAKDNSDVKVVYCHNCTEALSTFNINFCQKFQNLESIYLVKQSIEKFDPKAFDDCFNIKNLAINWNLLEEIPNNLLTTLPELKDLSFTGNEICSVHENAFANQKELLELDIAFNQISSLPLNVFKPLKKLMILELSGNQIESINPAILESLQHLRGLGLAGNKISVLQPGNFKFNAGLTKITLHDNQIETLSADWFEGLDKLGEISLFKNQIKELPVGMFTGLKSLANLRISDNQLTVIHADSFGPNAKLRVADFANNKISQIDEKFIDDTEISFIYMDGNVCSGDSFKREYMKEKLKACFENYKPRGIAN